MDKKIFEKIFTGLSDVINEKANEVITALKTECETYQEMEFKLNKLKSQARCKYGTSLDFFFDITYSLIEEKVDIQICPKCLKKNKSYSNFCVSCGKQLKETPFIRDYKLKA